MINLFKAPVSVRENIHFVNSASRIHNVGKGEITFVTSGVSWTSGSISDTLSLGERGYCLSFMELLLTYSGQTQFVCVWDLKGIVLRNTKVVTNEMALCLSMAMYIKCTRG